MRRFSIILFAATCASAQVAERPSFKTLRYKEDWSFLRDSTNRADFFDPAKYIPFTTDGDWYLSFGNDEIGRAHV